ncbi:MAG: TlpA disulfide reductase family protein [Bacteroidia bacterium]|nr:TlpA disulfide reductase family protein [Bacteroidia bacterium]
MKNHLYLFLISLFLFSCANPGSIQWKKVSVSDLEGQAVDLSQYEGKRIFLNIWATWCGPCRAEMPSMEAARVELEDENFVFVALSDESWKQIKTFKESTGYGFEFLRLNDPIKSLGIFSIPQTYIINSKGEVVKSVNGSMDWSSKESLSFLQSIP